MKRRMLGALLGIALPLCIGAASDTPAQPKSQFSIDWHVISPGATRSRSACFVLAGSSGQAAPGYSSGGIYALLSGFWTAAPITGYDQMFFDGFEGCHS
jgi:hypothetical protein